MKVTIRTQNNIPRRIRAGLVITNKAQEFELEQATVDRLKTDTLLHLTVINDAPDGGNADTDKKKKASK